MPPFDRSPPDTRSGMSEAVPRVQFSGAGGAGPAWSGGSVHYEIQTVGDDELPEGIHKVIVERIDGPPLLIINGEPARCWRLMRAWEAGVESTPAPTSAAPASSLLRAV